ncbi:hypothetical protein D0Q02_15865 [Micromonospora craniellae]|uniref:Legume lectin domain-containing protein n=1 Tax=Micromonospora craniellae TaxID=2294034 RepID=A0A372FXR2_9ACTN|nr:hypothetical protein D0Q02_15865 [Micromonospora craniellae]
MEARWRLLSRGRRGGLRFLTSLAGVVALTGTLMVVLATDSARPSADEIDEVPLTEARLDMLTSAAAACPSLRPARLAGQVMAATGFEPTTEGGIGGLTAQEWEQWKPSPGAVPSDERASLLGLARLTCDLIGRLRADGLPDDPWRLAMAAFGSVIEDVRSVGGVPAHAAEFVASVEAYTATYDRLLGATPSRTPPLLAIPATPDPALTGAVPTRPGGTTATPTRVAPTTSRTAHPQGRATTASPSKTPPVEARRPASRTTSVIYHPGFASAQGLRLRGTARVSDTRLDLTQGKGDAGSAWADLPIDVDRSFTAAFRAELAGPVDGFAFVIQKEAAAPLGGTAGGLGYGAVYAFDDPNLRIRPSVAIEFDAYNNRAEGWDPPGDQHIAVTRDGDVKNHLVWAESQFDMFSNPMAIWIEYNASAHRLSVFVVRDGQPQPGTPLFTHGVDLRAVLGSDVGYVGFTAGSGQWGARQSILTWGLASS